MIQLSLALNKVPVFKFQDIEQYIQENKQKKTRNNVPNVLTSSL